MEKIWEDAKSTSKYLLRASVLSLSLLLAACTQAPEDAVAVVGEKPISTAALLREDAYYEKVLNQGETYEAAPAVSLDEEAEAEALEEQRIRAQATLDRRREVLDQMVFDESLQQDTKIRPQGVTAKVDELYQEALDRFDGEEGLQAQLKAFGVTEVDYRAELEKEAYHLLHEEAYREYHPLSSEDLQKYYEGNREDMALVSYVDITVPTKSSADTVKATLTDDIGELAAIEEEYQNDIYDSTSVQEFQQIGAGDDRLVSRRILQQDLEAIEVYLVDELYHVIIVKDKVTDYTALVDHVRDRAYKDHYESYIQSLSRQLEVKVFPDRIPKE